MKARLIFYCAAVVALVLFLAATSSHATERRDPVLNPEQTQSATGHGKINSAHSKHSAQAKKGAHVSAQAKPTVMAQKNSPDGGAGSASKGK